MLVRNSIRPTVRSRAGSGACPFVSWLAALALAFLPGIIGGCGGKSGLSQPDVHGQSPADTAAAEYRPSDDSKQEHFGVTSDTTSSVGPRDAFESSRRDMSGMAGIADSAGADEDLWSGAFPFDQYADGEDSAAAVDDDIWREFVLVEEYHAMGVIANREAAWEEAQYYFEKALRTLAGMDIEADSLPSPEAEKYETLLDNIVADYRVTLRSLGHLAEDISVSALVERFAELSNNLARDTIRLFGETSAATTYDIPIAMNDRVKQSIIYFQTVAREAFSKFLRRLPRYSSMMHRILAEYDLPRDLVYLSMVESGFNPRAYSWARASGLWQFIASTGRLYGLQRDWWRDERRDPIKSTHAACRFLKDLYTEFGSWELAWAAYNGGPGRVRRTIEQQKTVDFWKMKLKRQTMDYVPLIMAAAVIARNPEKYGFGDVVYDEELTWDEVVIDRCLDLSVVAEAVGSNLQELQDLNPELLRRTTPPKLNKYTLKIPSGTKERFLLAFESLPSPRDANWVRHRIKRGESLGSIAAAYGVSTYAISEANNLGRTTRIYAGKELIIPVPASRGPVTASKSKGDYQAKNAIYTVRGGDNMWDIARAFGTTVDALRRLNYLERGARIYVGQKLKIPGSATWLSDKNETDSTSPVYASEENSESTPRPQIERNGGSYVVRRGDNLWDIARRFGTTANAIRSLNSLGPSSRLYPGQVLTISGESQLDYVIHSVQRGETLARIARKYRTTIARILEANSIPDPDNLQVGDKLRISPN
ncbi:MAG TPA: LysM peptidoglycan-binding domain-containing protein [Candidatus Deferrimicrobium sp.]|nr:LysM peptidoglycan-binding domain-containing protein [Candidatus Deferrimicrobium sp.]